MALSFHLSRVLLARHTASAVMQYIPSPTITPLPTTSVNAYPSQQVQCRRPLQLSATLNSGGMKASTHWTAERILALSMLPLYPAALIWDTLPGIDYILTTAVTLHTYWLVLKCIVV